MAHGIQGRLCIVACAALFAAIPVSAARAGETGHPWGYDYVRIAQAYADAMIADGRDTYGQVHSPLFAAALNRYTHWVPGRGGSPEVLPGIRGFGDRTVDGADPLRDQGLYSVLYRLTEILGDERYAREADAAIAWFFNHTASPVTGLYAWGDHIGWCFFTDRVVGYHGEGLMHEFHAGWAHWDRTELVAPGKLHAFGEALWQHQIGDKQTGDFCRHAPYDRHGPRLGMGFSSHVSRYVDVWSRAYIASGDPNMLHYMGVMVNYLDNLREESGAIRSGTGRQGVKAWPLQLMQSIPLLYQAGERLAGHDPALAERLQSYMHTSLDWAIEVQEKEWTTNGRFVVRVDAETLEPAVHLSIQPVFSNPARTEYGGYTHARVASILLDLYRDGESIFPQETLDRLQALFMDVLPAYLNEDLPQDEDRTPLAYSQVIQVMLDMHEITGDALYLQRADYFAREAVDLFFDDISPLPRASRDTESHYEGITGGPTLVNTLLDVHQRTRP